MNIFIVIALVIAVLVGGGYWAYQATTGIPQLNEAITDPKNCAYNIEGRQVVLREGYSREETASNSASELITQYFGNEALGDFNGDGFNDTALILTQSSGGSGTFYYAVAALSTNDGCVGTNGMLLGDRIAPQSTEFQNNQIVVNYVDRKKGEPMTVQPSIGVSRYFTVTNMTLVEVSKEQHSETPTNTLNLSNRGLTSIPSYVFFQTSLQGLNVSHNRLTGAIQAEIRHLSNLRMLDASYNEMTGVPAEIGQLQKLEVLNLSNNKLTGLPYELGNLKNLKTLNLSGNSYSVQDLNRIKSDLPPTTVIIVD